MSWRIYYADGTTFDDSEGTPEEAPSFGVLCIVCPDDVVGRVVLNRHNFYYWMPSQWWGSDLQGVLDNLLNCGGSGRAWKQGRNADNKTFQEIYNRAATDPDFPKKSGLRAGETPKE